MGQVYAAGRGKAPLRVYNLRYKDSFEQDRYMAALQREQRVFEDLIRSKGHMVLPELGQVCILTTSPVPSFCMDYEVPTSYSM